MFAFSVINGIVAYDDSHQRICLNPPIRDYIRFMFGSQPAH